MAKKKSVGPREPKDGPTKSKGVVDTGKANDQLCDALSALTPESIAYLEKPTIKAAGMRAIRKETEEYRDAPLAEITTDMAELRREYSMNLVMGQVVLNRSGAFVRQALGYDPQSKDKEAQKAIVAEANRLIIAVSKGEDVPLTEGVQAYVLNSLHSAAPFMAEAADYKQRLECLAGFLPFWKDYGCHIRGLGLLSLGTLIGETGDLNNYPSIQCLWKRLGAACMDGVHQSRLPEWCKGASDDVKRDEWIRRGYNKRRRCNLYNFCAGQVKAGGPYSPTYYWRKPIEVEKLAGNKDWKIRAHRRATLYMSKFMLMEMWEMWTGKDAHCYYKEHAPYRVLSTAGGQLPQKDIAVLGQLPGLPEKDKKIDKADIDADIDIFNEEE